MTFARWLSSRRSRATDYEKDLLPDIQQLIKWSRYRMECEPCEVVRLKSLGGISQDEATGKVLFAFSLQF